MKPRRGWTIHITVDIRPYKYTSEDGEMEVGMGRQVGFRQPGWCPSKAVSRGWESRSQVASRPNRAQGTLVAELRDAGRDPVLSP